MSSNKSIRVVKRDQREFLEEQSELRETKMKTERQERRLMFQTITSWIEEQREIKKQMARLTLLEQHAD
jgi:hypothetical protein